MTNHPSKPADTTAAFWVPVITLLGLLLGATPGHAESPTAGALKGCGSLENAYGPYDYSNPAHRAEHLPIVEQFHFDEGVFQLRRGMSARDVAGDIDYTLRAFPNHHRALDAMSRLEARSRLKNRPLGHYTIDCWFDRAFRWRPADGMTHLVYGIHLFRTNRLAEAKQQMLRATELIPDSAESHYNLGLLYVRTGNFSAARKHARLAYDAGHPLPGLRNQLIRAGEWQENPPD